MFSILNEIKKYVIKNGIPFNNISISHSYFPSYYNQAILNHLRKLTGMNYDMGPADYILSFDKNGSIYLMVHDNLNKTNLYISDTYISIDEDIRYTQVSESNIVEEACVLKLLNDERTMIREMINNDYSSLSMLDKVKLENNIINTLVKTKFQELIKNNENVLNKVSHDEEIYESITKIKSYIDYLNAYYLEDLKLEEEENQMKVIYFVEPDSDKIVRRSIGKGYSENKERNNPIIPANDRIDVLNSYHYIYRDFARSATSNEIEYINYLYKIDYNHLILIMEPYNGNKYTKMVILENSYIDRETFNDLVKQYLELSYRDFDLSGNTIKTNHTSLTTYEQIIDYAINGENDKVNNAYFKDKMTRIKKL